SRHEGSHSRLGVPRWRNGLTVRSPSVGSGVRPSAEAPSGGRRTLDGSRSLWCSHDEEISMSDHDAYRRAGFPVKHGEACQEVANELDRIIISRCAQEIGIQLLEENYASKGFGIKAKSCDWGPFAGFAMGHFQFSKFEVGLDRYKKQIQFFKDGAH